MVENSLEEKNRKMRKEGDAIDSEYVDYDTLLSSAGEFGKYQLFLVFCTFPFYIFGGFTYFSQMFITEVSPNHWCWVPDLANFSVFQRRNLAIPNDANSRFGYSQCSAYVANWSEVLQTGINPDSTWQTEPCRNGWEFNGTEIPYPTISSELGWVCDRDSYQASAQSTYFAGSVLGGLLFGWVSDRFGRIPAAVISNVFGCIGGVSSVFAKNFMQFAICRFIMGMSDDTCMMMAYLLVLEYVAPKYRAFMSNAPYAVFYSLVLVAIPWIALGCGHWKIFSLATSIPMGWAILAPLVIPESPRWLLSRGRIDDTVNKILRVAEVNRKEIPTKLIERFKKTASTACSQEGNNVNLIDLLKVSSLRTMFFCICILYMCNMIAYDATIRIAGQLNFDYFLSFTLLSVTELPSLLLLSFILDWAGRKPMTLSVLLISGSFSIITTFVDKGMPSVVCAMVARFTANMSFNTGLQWAAEILPTPVRGSGTSVVHIFGYVGTMISPFIVYLSTITDWLPMVVTGAICFLGAGVCLGLPETSRKVMPQTFDDAETMIKTSKFIEFPCTSKVDTDTGHTNNAFEMTIEHI